MKKFSEKSNTKIEEINEFTKQDGISLLKSNIVKLIDDFLSVQVMGVRDPVIANNTYIAGKDEFIDALMDMILDEDKLKKNETVTQDSKNKQSVADILDNAKVDGKTDSELALIYAQKNADKIQKGETAFLRGVAANHLRGVGKNNILLKKIADIYMHRAHLLGYTKNINY